VSVQLSCAALYALLECGAGVGGAGVQYDEGGAEAASGCVIEGVLRRLDELAYYTQRPPKSLGREWFEQNVLPIVDVEVLKSHDMLASYFAIRY